MKVWKLVDNINLDDHFNKAQESQYSSYNSKSNEDKVVLIYKAINVDVNTELYDTYIEK